MSTQPKPTVISPILGGAVAGILTYLFTKKPIVSALVGGAGYYATMKYNTKENSYYAQLNMTDKQREDIRKIEESLAR